MPGKLVERGRFRKRPDCIPRGTAPADHTEQPHLEAEAPDGVDIGTPLAIVFGFVLYGLLALPARQKAALLTPRRRQIVRAPR